MVTDPLLALFRDSLALPETETLPPPEHVDVPEKVQLLLPEIEQFNAAARTAGASLRSVILPLALSWTEFKALVNPSEMLLYTAVSTA